MHAVANWREILVAVLLCVGCGHSESARMAPGSELGDSGIPTNDASVANVPVSKAEFARRVSEMFCTNIQQCCAGSTAFVLAGCQAKALADAAAIVADPLISYDPAGAADCWAAIDTVTRECRLGTLSFEVQWDPCNRAFVGTLPLGAPCTDARQCALIENGAVTCGSDSTNPDSNVCLHYLRPPHAALGEECGCTMGETSSCSQIWDATGPSDDRSACYAEDGLYCDTKSGICKSIGDIGQKCQLFHPSCKNGLFCGDDETCQPIPREGDSCTQSEAFCESGLVCKNGRCAQLPDLGEQCEFLNDHRCTGGSHCSAASNTCVPPEPLGASCWLDSDCASGHCPLFEVGSAGHCNANPLSDDACAWVSR